jgi:LuxR family maltose regulon positive regulatory protein
MQKDRGYLVQAAETYQEAIELGHSHAGRSGQPLPVTGYAYVYLAGIHHEWNDLDAAQELVNRGVRLCVQWGEPQLLTSAYLQQAQICFSVGDLDGSHAAIQNAKRVAIKLSTWYAGRAAAGEVEMLIAQGDVETAAQKAEQLASQLATEAPRDLYEGMICMALTRLAIAQAKTDQALQWVPRLLTLYKSAGSIDGQIRTLIQQSIALQLQGKGALALDALQLALALAEPQRYVRTFVEAGEPLEELLRQALVHDISTSYVNKLLAARSSSPAPSLASSSQPSALLDPLTEREQEILRLLPTHLSSTEIADQLYVSKNTVRSHIGHIYDKLGVHSRVAAVERAQELELI